MLDGRMLCQDTGKGCSKAVPVGAHNVSMQKERYLDRAEVVAIKKGTKVDWKLTPSFGWLSVKSTPPDLDVALNGKVVGKSPIDRFEVTPGTYEVLVQDRCYLSAGKKVQVGRDETKVIDVALTAREGAITVVAEDEKGSALEAEVLVDGVRAGTTPGTFKVGVCAKKLEVKHTKAGVFGQSLAIKEKEVVAVRAVLKSGGGDLEWVRSAPAGIDFAKTETTVAEYRACVEMGKCSVPKDKSAEKYCNWGYADRDAHPVNCVDWNQATAFCAWAGGRLPALYEWYAEASNRNTRTYAWGNQKVTCDYAIWGGNWSGTDGCGNDSTWPVCSKTAGNSVSGLCDMGGNVWEWTSTSEGAGWLVLGGSWGSENSERIRAADRNASARRSSNIGFRCGRPSP
jgi:hypothetical protein